MSDKIREFLCEAQEHDKRRTSNAAALTSRVFKERDTALRMLQAVVDLCDDSFAKSHTVFSHKITAAQVVAALTKAMEANTE